MRVRSINFFVNFCLRAAQQRKVTIFRADVGLACAHTHVCAHVRSTRGSPVMIIDIFIVRMQDSVQPRGKPKNWIPKLPIPNLRLLRFFVKVCLKVFFGGFPFRFSCEVILDNILWRAQLKKSPDPFYCVLRLFNRDFFFLADAFEGRFLCRTDILYTPVIRVQQNKEGGMK